GPGARGLAEERRYRRRPPDDPGAARVPPPPPARVRLVIEGLTSAHHAFGNLSAILVHFGLWIADCGFICQSEIRNSKSAIGGPREPVPVAHEPPATRCRGVARCDARRQRPARSGDEWANL